MSERGGLPGPGLRAGLIVCLLLAWGCGGSSAKEGRSTAVRADTARAAAARVRPTSPDTTAAAGERPVQRAPVHGAVASTSGVPRMRATEAPWSPPPGPEPPRPTASYPSLPAACDSAGAWVGRATGSVPRREDGPAYEGRRGCILRAEFRTKDAANPDSLFLRAGWAYVKYHGADGPGSTVYALQSRGTFCEVRATWPVDDESAAQGGAGDEPPATLELGCVPRRPLDDLRTAIEHLGRSPDPVCRRLAREAHARAYSSGDPDARRRARFEDGPGRPRFDAVEAAPPRRKYDPTVPGVSYVTALSRFALAGQIALNEARALGRPDTASIVRRCTLFDQVLTEPEDSHP